MNYYVGPNVGNFDVRGIGFVLDKVFKFTLVIT